MKILISGSNGFIGSHLLNFLKRKNCEVTRLIRPQSFIKEGILWDTAKRIVEKERLEGFDAVINLAGENIASRRWTKIQKLKICESRVLATRFLSETIIQLTQPPKVFISASALGYYGNRGEEILTEENAPGSGFLANLCKEWEQATRPAKEKGIRVVNLRTAMVLSSAGGALAKMLLPFQVGLGATLGSGHQYMSWVALDDMLEIISFALTYNNLDGPINVCSPNPLTNREFTKTLARVLKKPALFSIPRFFLKILFGEMAETVLLASCRAIPKKLLEAGFKFQYPLLEDALRHLLSK